MTACALIGAPLYPSASPSPRSCIHPVQWRRRCARLPFVPSRDFRCSARFGGAAAPSGGAHRCSAAPRRSRLFYSIFFCSRASPDLRAIRPWTRALSERESSGAVLISARLRSPRAAPLNSWSSTRAGSAACSPSGILRAPCHLSGSPRRLVSLRRGSSGRGTASNDRVSPSLEVGRRETFRIAGLLPRGRGHACARSLELSHPRASTTPP